MPRARPTRWRALRLRIIVLLTERTRRNKDFPQLLLSASRRSLTRVARLCLHRSRWTGGRPLLPFRCCSLGRLKVDEGASRLSDLLNPDRRRSGVGGCCPWATAEGAAKPDLMTRLCSALVRIGPSQTIAGVTGPLRPGMRRLMSQAQARRGRPVWSSGWDACDAASFCLLVPTGGTSAQKSYPDHQPQVSKLIGGTAPTTVASVL